jgi:hypothetical protein
MFSTMLLKMLWKTLINVRSGCYLSERNMNRPSCQLPDRPDVHSPSQSHEISESYSQGG